MLDMCTVVSRYRATLDVYADTQYVPIATDKFGRIVTNAGEMYGVSGTPTYSSMRVGDGTDLLGIVNEGDAVSGAPGVVVFGEGNDGLAYPLPILTGQVGGNAVNVTGALDLNPTPGTDGDKHSDEGGAQTEPGVIGAIGTGAWVDIVSIALTTGTYVLQGVHIVADRTSQFRLVTAISGTPTVFIGNWMVTQNVASYEFDLPRAREIAGVANQTIKLQAIRRAVGSPDASASGRINGFTV